MEDGLTGSIGILLDRGILGVVCLALGFISWRLFKMVFELQEKRVEENREVAKTNAEVIERNVAAIEGLTKLIEDRRGGA